MAEVKGGALLGFIKFVNDKGGPRYLDTILKQCKVKTRALFKNDINSLRWYPYESYIDLMQVLDRELGNGDYTLCRELGRKAAERDIKTVYTIYDRGTEPSRLIQDCSFVWATYYRNAGKMRAISCDPDNTVLRISDFKAMSPAHCSLMMGWMEQMMLAIGARVMDFGEKKCMSRGDLYHEFVCSWEEISENMKLSKPYKGGEKNGQTLSSVGGGRK